MSDEALGNTSLDEENDDEIPSDVEVIANDVGEKLGIEKDSVKVLAKLVAIEARESFAGPLPHPRILRQYQEILPDSPERILHMAESQEEHRFFLERTVVTGNERRANWGLGLGFFLVFVFGIASIWLIAIGKGPYGLTTFILSGLAAIGSLVRAIYIRRRELASREGRASPRESFEEDSE